MGFFTVIGSTVNHFFAYHLRSLMLLSKSKIELDWAPPLKLLMTRPMNLIPTQNESDQPLYLIESTKLDQICSAWVGDPKCFNQSGQLEPVHLNKWHKPLQLDPILSSFGWFEWGWPGPCDDIINRVMMSAGWERKSRRMGRCTCGVSLHLSRYLTACPGTCRSCLTQPTSIGGTFRLIVSPILFNSHFFLNWIF